MINDLWKFRVWVIKRKQFLVGYGCHKGANHGGIEFFDPEQTESVTVPISWYMQICQDVHYTVQQWTRTIDKYNVDVFDGDVIKFKYQVGDQAWETMGEFESNAQSLMNGKLFTGRVIWDKYNCGYCILVGQEGLTSISFPMGYAKHGKVIGNLCENPELLEKCYKL